VADLTVYTKILDAVAALVDSEARTVRYLDETMVPVAYAMLFVDNVIMNALLASYVSFTKVCLTDLSITKTCCLATGLSIKMDAKHMEHFDIIPSYLLLKFFIAQ